MNNIHLFPNSFPPRSTKGSGLFCVRTLGFIAIDRVNEYHVLDESRDRHEKVDEDRDEIVNNLNIT